MPNKLYKSSNNLVIVGICGGIAEYFGFDTTSLRIIWFLSAGITCWLYIALWILMPPRPSYH
ncbi:MAG: PspC domain-containing protein [Cellulosilyticaceae bacterium]